MRNQWKTLSSLILLITILIALMEILTGIRVQEE